MPGKCSTCNLTIEGQAVTLQELKYHPECFVCHSCRLSLKGKACHIHEGHVYDPDCFNASIAAKCDVCYAPITGDNAKFFRAGDKCIHLHCYVCNTCNKSLQNEKYIPAENNKMVCETCFKVTEKTNTGITYNML